MNRTHEQRQAARVAAINSADETLACADCSKLSVAERKILRDCTAADVLKGMNHDLRQYL